MQGALTPCIWLMRVVASMLSTRLLDPVELRDREDPLELNAFFISTIVPAT